MPRVFDGSQPDQRADGITAAAAAVRRGALVVVPTETSYAVICDAFRPDAAAALRAAKGAAPAAPLSVLIGAPETADGLLYRISDDARDLIAGFWPGPLMLMGTAQPSLSWDLSNSSGGVVGLRMPLHPWTLELLRETGPVASSSANALGQDAPRTCEAAQDQLGDAVSIYLDGGEGEVGLPSTVVDITADVPTVLREGAFTLAQIAEAVPDVRAADAG